MRCFRKQIMFMRSLGLSAALAMFAMAGPAHAADAQGAAAVQVIKSFLKDIREAMASRDPARVRAVAERYMDEDYVQHARGLASGREGFIKGMSTMVTSGPPPGAPPGAPSGAPPGAPSGAPSGAPPGPPPTPKDLYFLGDGELVVWVSEGREPGKLVFNMVRVVNGKMKEHWDSN